MNYLEKLTCERPRSYQLKASYSLLKETEKNRDLVIQSAALRRLQQKTQVYSLESNAAVRSRLTHSLEVQQIGRLLAFSILNKWKNQNKLKSLGLENQEIAFTNLIEMGCLLHDVGNPPFGHFGEYSISDWLLKNASNCHKENIKHPTDLFKNTLLPDLCTFEGNAQGLRIVHHLQDLNLTYSQLATVLKYTRPAYIKKPHKDQPDYYRKKKPGYYFSEENLIKNMQNSLNIDDGCRFPLVYIMEAADDIAYCISDLEDALNKQILSLKELKHWLTFIWHEYTSNNNYLPKIMEKSSSNNKNSHDFIVNLRALLVADLVEYSANKYLEKHEAIFHGQLDAPLIYGESNQYFALKTLKNVALRYVFTSQEKETPELRGHSALIGLLNLYKPILKLSQKAFTQLVKIDNNHHLIEQRLYHRLSQKHKNAYFTSIKKLKPTTHYTEKEKADLEWYYRSRLIIDYISGMTDHFVVEEYQRLHAI